MKGREKQKKSCWDRGCIVPWRFWWIYLTESTCFSFPECSETIRQQNNYNSFVMKCWFLSINAHNFLRTLSLSLLLPIFHRHHLFHSACLDSNTGNSAPCHHLFCFLSGTLIILLLLPMSSTTPILPRPPSSF